MPRAATDLNHKLLLTPRQGMSLTGYPEKMFYAAIQSCELPAIEAGRGWLIRRADLDEFLRKRSNRDTAKRRKERREAQRQPAPAA